MLELFDQCIKKDKSSGKWYFDGSSLDGNDESLSDTILDRANYLIMLDMWIKQLPIEKEDRCTPEVTTRKPISQEEWDSKLYLGWSVYDLEKIFYVSNNEEEL